MTPNYGVLNLSMKTFYHRNTAPTNIRDDEDFIGITELRMGIGKEIDTHFIETDFTTFGSAYLPFYPEENYLDTAMEHIREKILDDDGLRFKKEFITPPSSADTEPSYFNGLLAITKAISEVPPPHGRKRNDFEYRHAPATAIASSFPGSSNFIDACIVRSSLSVRSDSICCPVVVKTKWCHEDEIKNNLQITSASVQIMNDDPRRMFTYGLTIVGDAVTSWYFSRSHSAISESFSFVQEPRKFIKLLVSFFFATEEELGYDPNTELDSKGRYIFSLPQENGPPRLFRAKRSICEDRLKVIAGRMTRVWLVTEHWDDPDLATDYVLKDVWIGVSDRTEKEIQAALFDGIEEFFFRSDPRDHPLYHDEHLVAVTPSFKDVFERRVNYKDYFMTIEADFRGQTSKAIAKPAWKKTGAFSLDLADHAPAMERRQIDVTPLALSGSLLFAQRRQYRVLFKELCADVGSLPTLGEVADVLEQILFALRLMLCAGWVHRDISPGNILASKLSASSWRAKLSDLEFAKKYPPEGTPVSYDPKIGTPSFMPLEILQSEFVYLPPIPFSQRQHSPLPVVMYNFQHDLESIYWILLWSSTVRTVASLTNPPLSLDAFSDVFSRTMTLSRARRDRFYRYVLPHSDMELLPLPIQETFHILDYMRYHLHDQYTKRERDKRLQDTLSFTEIHSHFATLLAELRPTIAAWDCSDLIPWS
ncbi:hypothetical protein ONZ45_g6778 [Pleurotus djamor]|nr:hypothetical protein ONZ45_g6778 [Pleurotus djamor]